MEVNETCIEVTSMSFYGPPCLLELSYTTHFFIQRCCCKFFVLPLFSLIFARFSSVPMKLQDGSSSLKRLFSAKFLKKMSKNQKEVPRAKNTKDFLKSRGGKILEILDSNFSRNKYQSENMYDTSHCITQVLTIYCNPFFSHSQSNSYLAQS